MAQEQAQAPYYDFMYPKYLLKRLYKIDQHEDDYLEDAYMVWRDIGNIARSTHAFKAKVVDGKIVLPCNFEFMEAVSTGQEYLCSHSHPVVWFDEGTQQLNNYFPTIDSGSTPVEHTDLHPKGEFVPYELYNSNGSKYVRVKEAYSGSELVIIYRGIIVDSDGNPCITRKEGEAIAHKIAYMETQLAAYTGDQAKAQMLGFVKAEAERKMQAAKIPEHFSQNFLDSLLSATTRHDRKVYNSSYKTIR